MAHSQPDTDKAPLAALSLLSLASASQTTPSSLMQVPRSAATTSVSHMPTVQPYSVQIPPASVPAISPPLSPPYSNRPGAIAGSRGSAVGSQPKARRLSSATQSKRRLSDATAATIQASAASDFVRGTSVMSNSGLSAAAASLSLSGSPSPSHVKSMHQVIGHTANGADGDGMDEDVPVAANGTAKKKGTIYRCESCSKVYRHPNCLLKHRWEHSPHWREASKFLLSKHQQVQLLEAAAILSHITPRDAEGGTSLPDDRSLWPSYLSGGLLPAPSTKLPTSSNISATKVLPPKVNLTSMQQPYVKKEDSSEDDVVAPKKHVGGFSSSSLPATSAFARIPMARATSGPENAAKAEDDRALSPGTFGETIVRPGDNFYYGSIGAIQSRSNGGFSPTSPTGNGFSFTSQSFRPPPMMSGGRRAGHRHSRTSSSVSSSYTRSSVRGGADDDDEDEDDDDVDVSVGYLALDNKNSFYGSVGTYSTSVGGNKRPGLSGEDYEFDEREEDDTADEDLLSDENQQGGAGMEIDMEL